MHPCPAVVVVYDSYQVVVPVGPNFAGTVEIENVELPDLASADSDIDRDRVAYCFVLSALVHNWLGIVAGHHNYLLKRRNMLAMNEGNSIIIIILNLMT